MVPRQRRGLVTARPAALLRPCYHFRLMAKFGRIKTIRFGEGYGFLTGNDGTDRFFHCAQVFQIDFDLLRAGQVVTFDEAEDRGRGPRAANVNPYPLVGDSPAPPDDES